MSFKRPKFYRHIDHSENAAFNLVGSTDQGHPNSSSEIGCYDGEESAAPALHWGDYLRPHHFDFSQGSVVLLKVEGRRDVVCQAISVFGSGYFLESDSSSPVEFSNGAIIVRAGERCKLFTFEEFRGRFVLDNGAPIETLYQIDYQTPRK